jgi:hypothetical protein
MFVASVESDSTVTEDDYPRHERWWDPETRPARPDEETAMCRHCDGPLGRSTVKICPNCNVVLHAECYEDTEGGQAYATEGCDACRHRTYWR